MDFKSCVDKQAHHVLLLSLSPELHILCFRLFTVKGGVGPSDPYVLLSCFSTKPPNSYRSHGDRYSRSESCGNHRSDFCDM